MSTTVPLSGTHAIVGMQGGTNGKDYQVIVLMALSTGTLEYRLEEDYLVQVRAV